MSAVDAINQSVLSPHNLPYRMRLLVQAMTRAFQDTLDPHGLTPLHWGVLCCLWEQDGLSTTELANRLEQLPGTVIAGLGAMTRRRLVKRAPDDKDRRVSRLWLTARGRELQPVLVPKVERLVREMFAELQEQEVRQLSAMVERLRERVDRM